MSTTTVIFLAAFLPLLALGVVWGVRSPLRVLLVVYAVLVPFGSGFDLPLGLPSRFETLSSLVGLLTAAAVVVHLTVSQRRSTRLLPTVPLWLLFIGVVAMTSLWSFDRQATVGEFMVIFSSAALFLVISLMPVEKRDVRALEVAIVISGAIVAVSGLIMLSQSALPTTEGGTPRLATAGGGGGKGAGANTTAGTLLLPLAVAAGRGLKASKASSRLMWFSAMGAIATAITLTGSRGGLLSVALMLIVMVLNERRRVLVGATALIVVAVVGFAVFNFLPDETRSHVEKRGSSGRTNTWMIGLSACEDYCWMGSGWGTFGQVYNATLGLSPDSTGHRLGPKSHSVWVQVTVEAGFLGIILLLLALGYLLRDVTRLPRQLRGPPLAGLIGVFCANTFLANLGYKYVWLAIIYATMVVLSHTPTEERETSEVVLAR